MDRLPWLRWLARHLLRRLLWSRLKEAAPADLRPSAWVFAPHQDDETLGCGGTILVKIALGARVRIAFLSDGSGSHRHLMPSAEVAELRREEALAAANRLGVPESDVVFVDLEDGRLSELEEDGAAAIAALLQRYPSEEIYVPYRHEPQPDHAACHRMVRTGLQRVGLSTTVCEYPIWFFDVWPWTTAPRGGLAAWVRAAPEILRTNAKLLRDFRSGVRVGDNMENKLAALLEYRSQMTREGRQPDWPILEDVAGGAFLECLLQPFEIFYRYRLEVGSEVSPAPGVSQSAARMRR